MRYSSHLLRRAAAISFSGLLLGCPAAAPEEKATTATGSSSAAPGFDQSGSDPQATAIADRVMRQTGGYDAWQNTRYLAGSFFGGQYQIWDKKTGDFHWEKDSLAANDNFGTKQGRVYRLGQDVSAPPTGQQVLEGMPARWNNNSWWLLMPFRLKDSGVTLTPRGEGKTMDGTPADVLQLTFKNVGSPPPVTATKCWWPARAAW